MGMRPLRLGGRGADRFVDLNLLPPALRPRVFPTLGVVLGLVAAAAVLLLFGVYALKASTDAEADRVAADLRAQQDRFAAIGGSVGSSGSGSAGAGASQMAKYRIGWSRVMQTIMASLPADIRLSDVVFSVDPSRGPIASVKGDAGEYAAVVEFADNLKSSPFFSRVSIQSMGLSATATVTSTLPVGPPPSAQTPTSPSGAAPPIQSPIRVPPTPQLAASPTPTPAGATIRPTSAAPTRTPAGPLVITPTIIAPAGSATATRTPSVVASPTPGYRDFVVSDKISTCDMSQPADYKGDLITGHVVDVDGSPLQGIRLRVATIYTASPWSAEATTDGDGFYRFYLSKYNYKVEVVSGASEVASELWTRSQSEPGACFWQVDFKKTSAATPVPSGSATATPTTTPNGTATRTPTAGPTAPSWPTVEGTPSASLNSDDADLAIDGSVSTAWNAGAGPEQTWEEDLGADYTLRAVSLVVSQNPAGDTTHVLHLLDSAGDEVVDSPITFSGYTSDGQVIQETFATPISGVRKLQVVTEESPSWVAWYEVRAYTGPSPTATPTPTATPLMEPDDAAIQARGIPSGTVQTRTFYRAGDVDWGWFYTSITGTLYFRALGAPGVVPEITLYEGVDQPRKSGTDGGPCDTGTDTMISFAVNGDTTYYTQYLSSLNTTGTYTITITGSAPVCGSSVPGSAVVAGASSIASAASLSQWDRPPGLAAPQIPADETPPGVKQPASFVIVLDIRQEGRP